MACSTWSGGHVTKWQQWVGMALPVEAQLHTLAVKLHLDLQQLCCTVSM